MFKDLVIKSRSCRKFDMSEPISREILEELVDLTRACPSAGNLQPLKYKLICDKEQNATVFSCLSWAGYLKDWPGPAENERPTGYILVLRDNEIASNFIIDHGITTQTIMLGAAEQDFAGCIMGSVDRTKLRETLELSTRYEILCIIALGKPAQTVDLEEAEAGDIQYHEDSDGTHHVPKRPLSEIILK